MNDLDLLKYAIDNGIIDMHTMRSEIEMKNRMAILAAHPYKIFQTSDNYFTTRFNDPVRGVIQRKRSTRKAIEDLIVEFYSTPGGLSAMEGALDSTPFKTFKMSFEEWITQQKEYGLSSNSISRYKNDYRRFFDGTDFEKKDVSKVTTIDVTNFCILCAKRYTIKRKAFNNLFAIIRGVIDKEYFEGNIAEQAYLRVNKRAIGRFLDKSVSENENRILDDKQADELLDRLHVWQAEKPYYIALYAVELAFYTGMRVGEISALKWSNINDDYIRINMSEKYDREQKVFYISETKTGKERKFPMTDDIIGLLERVRAVESRNGWMGEFVFSNENGRVHCRVISECTRNQCLSIGMKPKSIHAIRRTFNSNLRRNGVSETIAAQLLGHSPQVNRDNYTYDTSMMDDKRNYVSEACSIYSSKIAPICAP